MYDAVSAYFVVISFTALQMSAAVGKFFCFARLCIDFLVSGTLDCRSVYLDLVQLLGAVLFPGEFDTLLGPGDIEGKVHGLYGVS